MQSIVPKTPSLPQAGALVLTAALIAFQGCGVISDAPQRPVSTIGVPPSPTQSADPSIGESQTQSSLPEIPPIATVLAPPKTEPDPPIAEIPEPLQPTMVETGLASWYGRKFHGRRTASGEVYHQEKFTAAHRTLPWGSKVKVTNLANGKSVEVRINDRGPFVKDRIIDVSRAAARALGIVRAGIATVEVEWLSDSERSDELVLKGR
jgi:rare lipoprotein A